MKPASDKHISLLEYFGKEESATEKSEYYHGEIFAMTGASVAHNLIVSNIITILNNALRARNCFVFPGDIKVQVDAEHHYTYPDVSVVCGEIEFAQNRNDTISNPVAIFEVLSLSTRDYDRGRKFKAYRRMSSLREYILVDQYACSVEYFHRQENGQWLLAEMESPSDTFVIDTLQTEISLNRIYHQIDFDRLT